MRLADDVANTGIGAGKRQHRKREVEMCAAIRTVRARDAAAMRGDDRLTDGKADADSRILGAEEAVEDMRQIRSGNARPIVENGEDDQAVIIDRRLGIDPARRRARLHDRLDAVNQQVDDHLLQLNPVAHDLGKSSAKGRRQDNRL